jgi:putative pyrroloquinoline-quinone binding quinoprotein
MRIILPKLLPACVLLLASCVAAQVSVPTQHNNNNRTGENRQEPWLTTSNVNVSNFGKLFALPVDGNIYAQPLYVSNLAIAGAERNVLYVATEHNTVYAFDADDSRGTILWQKNLGSSVPSQDVCAASGCFYPDINPEIGITSTPVIDVGRQVIYVVAKNKDSDNSYHFRLHALNIISGAEMPGSPVEVTAPGFNVLFHLNHPGLLLANGKVYLGFGSLGDFPTWHGWLMAYDATTLQQKVVFNTSPSSSEGSIWQGGQGPVVDSAGNVYVATGNGLFNANTGGSAYGDSIIRLNGSSLSVLDYFTPDDQSSLSSNDADLGSGGPILLPGTNVLVSAGKDGWIRVMDTGNLGKFNATFDADLQEWQVFSGQFIGAPVYWSSSTFGPLLYTYGPADLPKAFRFNGSSFQTTPVSVGTIRNVAGDASNAALAVSSSGDTPGSGILWAAASASGDPAHSPMAGILRAFDATNLANEVWDSNQNSARDKPGSYAKYVSPVIANGKVYLATVSGEVAVYGLLAAPGFTLEAAPVSASVRAGGTVTYALSLTPQNGFSQGVSFTCFGLPSGASCSFNPSSVTTAGGPAQTVATVAVPAAAESSDSPITFSGTAGAVHGSTSVTLSVTDFDLQPSTAAATVKAGSTATYQLTLNPRNGFNSPVSLSCSAPPGVGISCVVDSSVTVAGAPATAQLSVTTTGPAAALKYPRHSLPLYATFLFLPAVLLQLGRVRQGRKLRHVLHCIGVLLLLMVVSCGGGGASNPSAGVAGVTPAGTYSVTVTARSGPLTRTTSVSLNVH